MVVKVISLLNKIEDYLITKNIKMKKIFQFLIIVCGSLLMNSCYYDELVERPIPEIPDDQVVEYAADIQTIWNSRCIGCHKTGSTSPDLTETVSYNNLVPEYVIEGDADASPLIFKLNTGHGNTSVEDMSLIKGWINQGAKNN